MNTPQKKTEVAPESAEVAATTPALPAPDAGAVQTQAQITVDDLLQVSKFLENLSQMGRLSQLEVAGIAPAFERIVGFLRFYEAQMQAAQAAQAANSVTEVSNEEIDTTAVKSKKKANKGKK